MASVMQICCHFAVTASTLFLVMVTMVTACQFPGFMQTNSTYRDWRGMIKSQFQDFTLTITVNGNTMRTQSSDRAINSYSRYCLEEVSTNTFLTSHQEEGETSRRYACVRFLQRGENVVQLKTSEVSGTRAGLCEDSALTLDPWIIVDKSHVLSDSEVCPLVGGYGLILYDKEYTMGICDGYSDNAILESECIEGDGLYFSFRYTRCIPNVLMALNQRTICLLSWVEEDFRFILIRSDTRPYAWIIRYPAEPRTSFVGHLMKDLFASTDVHLSDTNKYVRMNTVQNVPRPVTNLCNDESEGCAFWDNPCTMGDSVALMCPRTCGACNVTRPRVCSFQSTWQGDWIDASHGDRVATTFEPSLLTAYYSRLQQKFHCVHFDEPHVGPTEKFTTYLMLVSEFENGCRLKYSCAKVLHDGESPVMFLQLSLQQNWPFTSAISEPVNCHSFSFDGEDETSSIVPNKYRSKHYKLLYSKALDRGAHCNVPLQDIYNYSVTFRDDTQCFAGLHTWSSRKTFSLNMSSCGSSEVVSSVPLEHHCVDSNRYFSSEQVIVTRTGSEPYQIFCWIFPKRTRENFYLVEAAHCNENTKKRISKGRLKVLAMFSRSSGVTTAAPEVSSLPFSPSRVPGRNSTGVTDVYDRNSSKGTNSTRPPTTNPAAYASPVVVIAAIIFFVIFQVPCACKTS